MLTLPRSMFLLFGPNTVTGHFSGASAAQPAPALR
jgi:hypothetical protein